MYSYIAFEIIDSMLFNLLLSFFINIFKNNLTNLQLNNVQYVSDTPKYVIVILPLATKIKHQKTQEHLDIYPYF